MSFERYSTDEFEKVYTYTGNDLGSVWSKHSTRFRLWAPTASQVKINLYVGGTPGVTDLMEQLDMIPSEFGTWIAEKHGNLNGVYYTYLVTVNGNTVEVCDPYARTTGVNGHRAMIMDLASANPEGWETDRDPNAGKSFTDGIIYELHIRDLSLHPSSGINHTGKFLGLTETGTATPEGTPTGLDHIKNLGITHLHILPFYDYGSVDESKPEVPQFNWGYDPVNFNVPEGSYSTDPFHGEVRVAELKQTVKTLHDNGISVIMDVVYNHVFDADTFCINRIVPGYFSRQKPDGSYSNGSGCGNDTATERSMVRKYLVDSVKYWADEYHIDGFRFDLVGLIDVKTVNEIVETVHRDHPNVVFYGEGWSMDTHVTKPNIQLATQKSALNTPGFSYFNDTIRDLLKGTVFSFTEPGFVSGAVVSKKALSKVFMGLTDWCPSPIQSINYASCHDNMTLFDRIANSVPQANAETQIRMNNLAAAFYMLSQGVPFLHAGEEFLRTKRMDDGTYAENSYNLPDSVNCLKWDTLDLAVYQEVYRYYRGLISFRKAHPDLRYTTAQEAKAQITPLDCPDPQTVAFRIRGAEDMILAFHAGEHAVSLPLPDGNWIQYIGSSQSGTEPLRTCKGVVNLPPISAAVLIMH